MKDIAKEFGLNVRKVRKSKKIAQDELARRADIDRSYMGIIERGEMNITLEKVYRIASALDCDVKDLLP